MNYDVVVVGAGASGLVAAIVNARLGRNVVVLEHKEKPGKKILATGNGKCNYTNLVQEEHCYRSDQPEFCKAALDQLNTEQTIDFFKELGIFPKNKNGYLYPNSEQAASVLEVLLLELEHLQVEIKCDCHVKSVEKTKKGFHLITTVGEFRSHSVILATGGRAGNRLGSDGSGYDLAKSFGHSLVPVVPALVALKAKEKYFAKISGVRVECHISLQSNGMELAGEYGELQLTNYGISGIPVFQISRYAARALYEKKDVQAVIDFMPEQTDKELFTLLMKRIKQNGYKLAEKLLTGMFNDKLGRLFMELGHINLKKHADQLSKQEIMDLVQVMKAMQVHITEPNPFENAQVCAGGVNTKEIDPNTMESKLVPGLYFAGELVDVDGTCGGYNLQWAWSSGYVAGMNAY